MNRSALDLMEESIRLLQRQSAAIWFQYLLGAVPFLLALLAFEHDMTVGYNASRCGEESLICALLFFWLNAWKSRFSGSLLLSLSGEHTGRERSSFTRCFLFQTIIQTTKLICLPLAAFAILPLPWTSAFYRSVTVEADRAGNGLSSLLQRARAHASWCSAKNWIGLLLFTLIGLVVMINLLILLMILPELIRALTGSENDWTRNAAHALNWQTFLEALVLTWFSLDPVIQSFAVIRCFYAEARNDGRDLLANLRRIAALALLILAIGAGSTRHLQGSEPPRATPSISPSELDRGVNDALKQNEYRWRLSPDKEENGFLQSLTHRLGEGIDAALKRVNSWFNALGRWLRKLLHPDGEAGIQVAKPMKPDRSLPWIVAGMASAIALALVITIVQKRRQKPESSLSNTGIAPKADLSDENLLSHEVPEDEWLQLAKDYIRKGELRLAIRAMYLSNLASLGQRRLIDVTRSKSNRLYERELRIRSRADALCDAFASCNRDYERAWFGLHEVTSEQIDKFENRLQAIRAYGT
jgi:hypothetical protein